MTLTKKDITKLNTFYLMLTRYLNDWKSQNYFFYASKHQAEICAQLSINCDDLNQANLYYKELDDEDKESVKDMLRAKEINFKANTESPLHHIKFRYIKKC